MKYLNDRFSVNYGGKDYSDGWDRIFGQQTEPKEEAPKVEPIVIPETLSEQVEQFHTFYEVPIASKPSVPNRATIQLRLNLIKEEFLELLEACGALPWAYSNTDDEFVDETLERAIKTADFHYDELPEVIDALADLDYVIEGFRKVLGVKGAPVAKEVHRSNMSKLGEDGRPVRRADGKILKGPNFTPPDIADELRKQGWVD